MKKISIITMTALCVILSACASPQNKAVIYKPAQPITLRFKTPLIIKIPTKEPATVEDRIRLALFYVDKQRFDEANKEFNMARQRITDPKTTIYRACLISSAVCLLLIDDKPSYVKTVKELKSTFNQYELIDIENRDQRLKTIFELYDAIIKAGNY